MWVGMACLSALFAGVTAILAKCGIRKTDSDIATALRTGVVLFCAWTMVLITGSASSISALQVRPLLFLLFSGLATGASWLCYFKALSIGDVSKVAPVDKSSTVLTVLLGILCFGETEHLAVKLVGTILLSAGILFMVEPGQGSPHAAGRRYLGYAVASAVFAALTSILAKAGVTGIDSNFGTAVRTTVVLLMAWLVVLGKGKGRELRQLDRKECCLILLSGLATGASWLCYYRALQDGDISVVVPIDKMSLLVTILFSRLVLRERLSRRALAGLAVTVAGTLLLAVFA